MLENLSYNKEIKSRESISISTPTIKITEVEDADSENDHELDLDLQSLRHEVLNEEFFSLINEFLENRKKIEVF